LTLCFVTQVRVTSVFGGRARLESWQIGSELSVGFSRWASGPEGPNSLAVYLTAWLKPCPDAREI